MLILDFNEMKIELATLSLNLNVASNKGLDSYTVRKKTPKLRKTKFKDVGDATKKINIYIKKLNDYIDNI